MVPEPQPPATANVLPHGTLARVGVPQGAVRASSYVCRAPSPACWKPGAKSRQVVRGAPSVRVKGRLIGGRGRDERPYDGRPAAPGANVSDHAPDHPPKTPPPPKRPISPPRPETGPVGTAGPRMLVHHRRSVNWLLESSSWAPKLASDHVVLQLHEWGHRERDRRATDLTELLVRMAAADGGRQVSVQLADQGQQALIVALSHRPMRPVVDGGALLELAGLGAASCGMDTAEDGRRVWAVLDL